MHMCVKRSSKPNVDKRIARKRRTSVNSVIALRVLQESERAGAVNRITTVHSRCFTNEVGHSLTPFPHPPSLSPSPCLVAPPLFVYFCIPASRWHFVTYTRFHRPRYTYATKEQVRVGRLKINLSAYSA